MTKKLNYIKLPRGTGIKIAKIFSCTPAKVSQALNGLSPNTELTKKIRHTALTQYNGKELTSVEPKQCKIQNR